MSSLGVALYFNVALALAAAGASALRGKPLAYVVEQKPLAIEVPTAGKVPVKEKAPLSWLTGTALEQKRYDEAEEYGKQWLAIAKQFDDKKSETNALSYLAEVAEAREDYAEAETYSQSALDVLSRLGDCDDDIKDVQDDLERIHKKVASSIAPAPTPPAPYLLSTCYCYRCGLKMLAGARYCNRCGEPRDSNLPTSYGNKN
jgi:tetratricopeptide (TPR) repeat protein